MDGFVSKCQSLSCFGALSWNVCCQKKHQAWDPNPTSRNDSMKSEWFAMVNSTCACTDAVHHPYQIEDLMTNILYSTYTYLYMVYHIVQYSIVPMFSGMEAWWMVGTSELLFGKVLLSNQMLTSTEQPLDLQVSCWHFNLNLTAQILPRARKCVGSWDVEPVLIMFWLVQQGFRLSKSALSG